MFYNAFKNQMSFKLIFANNEAEQDDKEIWLVFWYVYEAGGRGENN